MKCIHKCTEHILKRQILTYRRMFFCLFVFFNIKNSEPTKHDERDAQVCGVVGGPGQVQYSSSGEARQSDRQQGQQSQPGFGPHAVPHGAAEDGQHPAHSQAGQQGATCQHGGELEVCPQRGRGGGVEPQLWVQRCKLLQLSTEGLFPLAGHPVHQATSSLEVVGELQRPGRTDALPLGSRPLTSHRPAGAPALDAT